MVLSSKLNFFLNLMILSTLAQTVTVKYDLRTRLYQVTLHICFNSSSYVSSMSRYGTVMGGLLSEKFLDTNLTIPFAGPPLNTPSLQKYKRVCHLSSQLESYPIVAFFFNSLNLYFKLYLFILMNHPILLN